MSSPTIPSTAVHSKQLKDEYQNWLAVGHAFCLMNEGLRPYITREMETLYKTLLALPPCACIYDNTRKKNPWHDMTCCAWAKKLQGLHQANKPKWSQSESSKWNDPRIGCWEIAKLFMSDLGGSKLAVVDAQSTDVTGLMNILCWCKPFNTLLPDAKQVRNDRNTKWAHTPNSEISLADRNCVIANIINLLNAHVLSKDADIQNALQQIKQINIHFDAQNVERKILLDFFSEMKNALDDMKMRLTQCEGTKSKDRKEIEALEKRVTSYEKTLIKIKQRIRVMETSCFIPWFVVVQAIHELRKRSSFILMLLVLIVSAVHLDPNTYDDKCPGENRPLHFNVKEFNFTRQLDTAREGFVGRQWLYKDVKSKLQNPNTSTVLIVGDPGSGKSAIAAQLICSRNSELSINLHIIAYHLCQHYNKETQEPGRFIRNIVDMIARRLPEYENIIVKRSLTERLQRHDCEGYPQECFEEVVVMPLKHVMKTKQPDGHSDDIYYIVLDALDECIPAQGGPVYSIVDLIKDKASRFPKNIKIVATTRNDTSFIGDLESFTEVVAIDPSDSRNEEDIAFYIDSSPDRRFSFINKIMKYFSFSSSELRMKESQYLVKLGQGNFLFVKLLAQYRRFDPGFTATPKTIGQVYEGYFRRSYLTRETFKHVRSVLEILVSALQPLRKEDIFYILSLQNNDLVYEYFLQDFNTLSHFLRYGENNTVSLFHKSLMEWLTSEENREFFIQRKEGHRKMIPYYIELIKNNDTNNTDITKLTLDLARHIASGDVYNKYVDDFHNLLSVAIKKVMEDNTTFLHFASTINNTIVIKLFLPHFKNNVDCIDSKGLTPAFISASRGFLSNVKLLVNLGANVNHKTNPPPPLPFKRFEDPVIIAKREFWYSTMLHAASQQGYLDVVEYILVNNVSILEKNGVGMTALQLAAEHGHLEIVQLLHSNGAVVDQLALHHAAMNGHEDVVDFLLSKGVTDDCMRCDGSFYWLQGNRRYQSLWIGLERQQPYNDIDLYIFHSIKVDKDAKYTIFDDQSLLYCETALHVAVARRHLHVTQVLLSHKVLSFNCPDYSGRTPLHIAAAKNSLEIMNLLIGVGARLTSKCSFVQRIQLRSYDDSMYILKKYKYLSFKEEGDYFTDVCSCDHTPIDVAATLGHIESARLLLKHDGSLASNKDCNGASIIHIAACRGHHHFIRWIIRNIRDININSPSTNGSTPLHSAAYCGRHEEVKQLISDGANTRALDKSNMTVLHYTMLGVVGRRCEINMSQIEYISDYSEYETYFKNDEVTVRKSKIMTHFLFEYMTGHPSSLHEVVQIDEICRTQEALLGRPDDHFYLLSAKDSKRRTALELAVVNGLKCSCVILLKNIIRRKLQHFLRAKYIWKAVFSETFFKKIECEKRNVLMTAIAFFKRFITRKSRNCPSSNNILLAYLQNRIRDKMIETWLLDLNFEVNIACETHFMESELHLLSYWPPTNENDNFFFTIECKFSMKNFNYDNACCPIPGPLPKALQHHHLGLEVLNHCRDLEGYTPLHRAAQGGNILAIKYFLNSGADVTATSTDWNQTALELAVSYAGNRNDFNAIDIDEKLASDTSILLLERSPHVKIICDGSATNLTIYHIAAYRGMVRFVKKLLENRNRLRLEINCPDVNGITPLYLTKLRDHLLNDSKENPWREIIDLIESHGGKLYFPLSSEAEHHVLYRHMYKNLLHNTNKDQFEYMLALYKDRSGVNSCLQNNSTQDQRYVIVNQTVELAEDVKRLADEHPNDENSLSLNLISSDLYLKLQQFTISINEVTSSTPKADNDSEIPDESKQLIVNKYNKDFLQKYKSIVELNKRNIKKAEHSLSSCHHVFSKEKLKFQLKDIFVGEIQDILNKIGGMEFKIRKQEYLKKEIKRYHQSKFCGRFLYFHNLTLTYFEKHIVYSNAREFSVEIMNIRASDFLQSRLPLTAIPEGPGHYLNRNLKTLVHGTRYLLDLILDRKTKFDYLKILSLGKTPETRLFYEKGKPEDFEKQERSIAKLNEMIESRRMFIQEVLQTKTYKFETYKKYLKCN